MNAYYPIAREEKFLYLSKEYFSIGFDESAILLDKNLKGYTNPCKTFNSPKLNNKKGQDTSFICIKLEIYALNFYWLLTNKRDIIKMDNIHIMYKPHQNPYLIMSFFYNLMF